MIKILRFILPLKKHISLMLVLLVLQIFGTLYIPTMTADIVNNGIVKGDIDYIWQIGFVMIGIAIAAAICSIIGTYLSSYLASSLGKRIRSALFTQSQKFSINDFNHFGTASMLTRNTNDVTIVQQTFSSLVEMLLPAPIMIIVGLVLAFSKDSTLGFIIIGAMIIVSLAAFVIESKAIAMIKRLQKMLDRINRVLRENITGIRVIRAFNRSDDEKKKEDEEFEDYAKSAIKVNKLYAYIMPAILITMNFCTVLIIWLGGKSVSNNIMQIGDIMAIIEYATIILMYLVNALIAFTMVPRAEICAQRINEVLNHKLEFSIDDSKNHALLENAAEKPKLSFKNVTFRYKGAEKPVLEDISFDIYPGQTLAIIGGTGSGKSTIASLIPRFYDIESGDILIDGVNTKHLDEDSIRKKIGYVPQKAFLFSGTIADNLKHGKENASLDDMKYAAKIAQIDDFIDNLDNGYDSHVAQAGNNFSGGQKQRLSIARALIRKPDIYVFDDSFSALDFKTDAKLRMALNKEIKNSAVVLIAQRISTIMNADKILVLDEGKIAGIGTHKELLKNSKVYQQIAETQLSKEELE